MRVQNTQGSRYVVPAIVAGAAGRSADVSFNTPGVIAEGQFTATITTSGRDGPTSAEKQKERALREALQGDLHIVEDNPWVKKIHFPSDDFAWPSHFLSPQFRAPDFSKLDRPLNMSQLNAVENMLSTSNESRLTLIQGPPGTGKTTVIATFVHFAVLRGQKGIWLTAQSNVAVKNIAEKLFDSGFMDWKLLVSKDFHYDWFGASSVIEISY